MSLTVTGPTKTVTTRFTAGIKYDADQSKARIAFFIPLSILPDKIRQNKGSDGSIKDTGISLSGFRSGWDALAVSGDTGPPMTMRIDLTFDKTVKANQTLELNVPIKAVENVTSISIQCRQVRMHHKTPRLYGAAQSFDLAIAPAGSAAAAKPLPKPKVTFEVNVDTPTALEPGTQVTISWTVEKGVAGTIKGPFPSGETIHLSTDPNSRYSLAKDNIKVWAMANQDYLLDVVVDLGQPMGKMHVKRFIMLDVDTGNKFSYLAISPPDTLPYGQVTVRWAAWGVNKASLEVDPNIYGPTEVLKSSHQRNDSSGKGHLDFNPIDKNTKARLTINLVDRQPAESELAQPVPVEIREWAASDADLPTTKPPIALEFASSDPSKDGYLALCAEDGLWIADVGTSGGGNPQFNKVEQPQNFVRWLGLKTIWYPYVFVGLREMTGGVIEIVQVDYHGKLAKSPFTLPDRSPKIVAGNILGDIQVFDLDAGKVVKNFPHANQGANTAEIKITGMRLSPDGKHLISVSTNGTLNFLNMKTEKVDRSIQVYKPGGHDVQVNTYALNGLVINERGNEIITAGPDIRFFDLNNGKLKATITISQPCNALAISRDNSKFAANDGHSLAIWDVETRQKLRRLKFPDGSDTETMAAEFTPDGQYILSGDHDSITRLWRVDTGELVAKLQGPDPVNAGFMTLTSNAVTSLAISSDGKLAIVGYNENEAIIWNLKTHKRVQVLKGSSSIMTSVAFTPDNALAATVGEDNQLTIWNVNSGEKEKELHPYLVEGRLSKIWAIPQPPLHLEFDGTVYVVPESGSVVAFDPESNSLKDLATSYAGWTGVTGFESFAGRSVVYDRDLITGKITFLEIEGPGEVDANVELTVPPDVKNGQNFFKNSTPLTFIVDNGWLVLLTDGSYKIKDPLSGEHIPQDWVFDPGNRTWNRCGHGIDMEPNGQVAYRYGDSKTIWAVGGAPVGQTGKKNKIYSLRLDGLHVFADPDSRG
ncbi:MAG: hypothetical protein R3293_06285 [Candidatus Promineifilaceae bacterium]|nr:hypothetical protein [Candidatus Promineifilaceae bacterium]